MKYISESDSTIETLGESPGGKRVASRMKYSASNV